MKTLHLDKLVNLLAVTLAPILTLLVDQGVLTATVATDLGAVIAALVGGYHVNNDKARAALTPTS